jgi:putative colanic acid biosynthesis acetyltransferase WcaF
VKYPWLFAAGDNCWIGEDCWIDNLAFVRMGSNVCISQGAYFCTGNHDWSDPAFGLIVKGIEIHDGAWVGAKAVLTPGVKICECAVVAAGSVVTQDIPRFEVHGGNPARFLRRREIRARQSTEIDHPVRRAAR